MGHKYDEFYRLLVDAHVVTARAVREAEALGLKSTLDEVENLRAGLVKVANNVMTKIESDHIAGIIDRSGAPNLTSAVPNVQYRSVRADIARQQTHYGVTPQLMYTIITEERQCHDSSSTPATAEGLACPAPDPGCGPTE